MAYTLDPDPIGPGIGCSKEQSQNVPSHTWNTFIGSIGRDIGSLDENDIIIFYSAHDIHAVKQCLNETINQCVLRALCDVIYSYLYHDEDSILNVLKECKMHHIFKANRDKLKQLLSVMAVLVIDKHSDQWFGFPRESRQLNKQCSNGTVYGNWYHWYMFWDFRGFDNEFDICCMELRDKLQHHIGFQAEYSLQEQIVDIETRLAA
eukprot:997293_1